MKRQMPTPRDLDPRISAGNADDWRARNATTNEDAEPEPETVKDDTPDTATTTTTE